MREEVKRILKMVQDGKLTSDEAAELIEAFEANDEQVSEGEGRQTPPPPPPGANINKDPFRAFVETMEKFGKEASQSVNWQEVAGQVRQGTMKGVEGLRRGLDDVAKGRMDFASLFRLQETKDITLPLSIPAGKLLKIENLAGNVKVAGGFDNGSAHAVARFRGLNMEDAKEKAASYTLIIEESEHQVLIRQPDITGLSVDLTIQMEGAGNVEIKCDAGDVSVLDTNGAARIASKHGDVALRGLKGIVEVSGNSGDISVEDTHCPSITVENKEGDVTIKRVKANVNVRTSSGQVELADCGGKVISLEAVSGDVFVDLSEPITGSVNIRTVSANSTICLLDGSDCRVSLSTLRGQTTCDLDLEEASTTGQRVTGRLGSGNGTLDVSAVSGDIHLKLRDQVSS